MYVLGWVLGAIVGASTGGLLLIGLVRLRHVLARRLAARNFDLDTLAKHFAADLREAALLWFVFANLDALVSGKFTIPYGISHTTAALAVWLLGAYLEVKPRRKG